MAARGSSLLELEPETPINNCVGFNDLVVSNCCVKGGGSNLPLALRVVSPSILSFSLSLLLLDTTAASLRSLNRHT